MNIALQDKKTKKYMDENGITEFLDCSNEGEALAIAGGHYLATGERANVYISADGFCNALNFFTSWIMPDAIEVNMYVSIGRMEPPHKVMSETLPSLLELLNYDTKRIYIEFV